MKEQLPYDEHIHALILSIVTIAIIVGYYLLVVCLNNELKKEYVVKFDNYDQVEINAGPVWFIYDKNEKELSSIKRISNEDKLLLASLFPIEKTNSETYTQYVIAIDKLAYLSNKNIDNIFSITLILGALGGALGVMIRSLSSFVFHASYIKDLNMAVWWPWYYLRPVMGLGIGITIIILSKSSLLKMESTGELSGFWILGVCILGGFAVSEVTDRLYYSANTLFGGDNSKKNSSG